MKRSLEILVFVMFWLPSSGCGDAVPTNVASTAAALRPADQTKTEASCPGDEVGPESLGRQTLDPGDGWASVGGGTTGGSLATPTQVYVVRTRSQLIAALNNGVESPISPANPSNEPKIIQVDGTIDFNVDASDVPLACVDYQRDGFTLSAFLAAFDPATWGRVVPAGPLEAARIASRNAQQDRVRIRVGSNTTMVGLGGHARLRGAWLDIRGTSGVPGSRTNIIIRNISFQDTHDCFPQWVPADGASGNWNALYDAISLRDADHVWIDGNLFEDRQTADHRQPHYFGVLFQVHDGLIDITNASDLITVSWNRFRNHDKAMLIGSSDSATADRGKLRVTIHHNWFDRIGQRAPRVRFGQVHVYDNLYKLRDPLDYLYSWGVGVESAIYAENNTFETDGSIPPRHFIQRFGGAGLFESGTMVDSSLDDTCDGHDVDVAAEWNAANDPDLSELATWTPLTPLDRIQLARDAAEAVRAKAGPSDSGVAYVRR